MGVEIAASISWQLHGYMSCPAAPDMTKLRKVTSASAPSPTSIGLVQNAGVQIQPDEEELSPWYDKYRRVHASRIAVDVELLTGRLSDDARILDIGAAPFLLTGALTALGYRPTAVDLEPKRFASSISALGFDVRKCDIENEDLPFADASFDAIVLNEVFEHLRVDLIQVMGEVRRVLAPAGQLFLSTPNARSLRGLVNFNIRNVSSNPDIFKQYSKLRQIGHMGHVREYTSLEVVAFLEHFGLVVEEVRYRGEYRNLSYTQPLLRVFAGLRPYMSLIARAE